MFLLSLKSIRVLEEVNNLLCALIVSQERGVHMQLIVYTVSLSKAQSKRELSTDSIA